MVNAALKYEQPIEVEIPKNPIFLPSPLKYGSVSIAQMVSNGHRYDASAYNIEAMNALRKVKRNRYGYVNLLGQDGFIEDAFVGSRFKRIYTDNPKDIPFICHQTLRMYIQKQVNIYRIKLIQILMR